MALYAYDEDHSPIHASEAEERRRYRCFGCHQSVRVRKGPLRVPHFYHLSLSASCRLYGKSQDHLLAQLALQKILPPEETILEKLFPEILRVGDLVWEPKKIIFEIQCSNISQQETEIRVTDYRKMGYQIVWILDDRIFNRSVVRPAEKWMRHTPCYYATLRGQEMPLFYDQFEIFVQQRRIKKGHRLQIQIDKPCPLPEISWNQDTMPTQILQKKHLYFQGDLFHKALLSHAVPSLAVSLQNLRTLELLYQKKPCEKSIFSQIISCCLLEPLGRLLFLLQKKNEEWG